ncbi:MAG: cytochrome c [Myxococcota bacterium]
MRIRPSAALWISGGTITLLLALTPAFAASGNRRPSDAERGEELYDRHCMACHGADGRGQGPATPDLVQPVPSMEGVVTKASVNGQVPTVLTGKGLMPGFEASFDRYDARRVLRHLAKVAGAPPTPPEPAPAEAETPADSDAQADSDAPATDAPATDPPAATDAP